MSNYSESIKQTIIVYVKDLFNQYNICKSHDINHILRVLNHIELALKEENIPTKTKYLIIYAALLHDVDDGKFFNTVDYDNARFILNQLNFTKEDIDLIIKMISYVSCSTNRDNIPEDALINEYLLYPRYADRLDALGKNGVIRCYQYMNTKNGKLFVDTTIKPKNMEEIWEIANLERYNSYNGNSDSMIDHYYDKLLLLGNFKTNNKYFTEIKKEMTKPFLVKASMDNKLDYEFMDKYCYN
jgi:uncharacterized protein